MERFLAEAERRAFRIALLATRNRDDALDLVQDAMLNLVQHYAERDAPEWPMLFHRILHNRIMDWHRRQKVRKALFGWLPRAAGTDDVPDPIAEIAAPGDDAPAHWLEAGRRVEALDTALGALPARQRQAFLLRVWEGFDVAETAQVMGCSEGSVKTHYSRACAALRQALEGLWP